MSRNSIYGIPSRQKTFNNLQSHWKILEFKFILPGDTFVLDHILQIRDTCCTLQDTVVDFMETLGNRTNISSTWRLKLVISCSANEAFN